jgi:hypothetical protein
MNGYFTGPPISKLFHTLKTLKRRLRLRKTRVIDLLLAQHRPAAPEMGMAKGDMAAKSDEVGAKHERSRF